LGFAGIERKNQMKRAMFAFFAMAAAALAQGTTSTSITTTTENYVFPPIGLATTETASVALVNIAPVPATAGATAPSCTGTVTFASSTGATIGKATAFTVGSGQIATVNLPFGNSNLTSRGEILASVQQTITRPSSPPCSLVFSLSTFDTTTGVTHLFVGNTTAATVPVSIASLLGGH
jgi:hypothetical protein